MDAMGVIPRFMDRLYGRNQKDGTVREIALIAG